VVRRPVFVALVLGLITSIALSACGANVNLRVVVNRSGSGSVTLAVTVPKSTAALVEDLKNGLPVGDLRAAGWVVDGPRAGPAGSTVVSASHTFSDPSEVPALVADIAGSGPAANRPFRLAVQEQPGFLQNSYSASGSVDLRCSLACFDDPKLATSVGYALGMPASEVRQLVGNDPKKEITFQVEVLLPGQVTTTDAGARAGGSTLVWSPVLGQSTSVVATSKVVDNARVRDLAIAVAAGALIVVMTAFYLVWSSRRRRRRGGFRFR
jgi:hypothetical protein